MKKNIDYIMFILLLAFTTFEYFFRADKLYVVLAFVAILIAVVQGLFNKNNITSSVIGIFVLTTWTVVQGAFTSNVGIISTISLVITLLGALSIALIVKDRFVSIFVAIIYYISIIALIIYILCLSPSIKQFLIDVICPNFTSLNVEDAVFDGGGRNFIIYNFVNADILEETGLLRNSGPFWEPGMFAVFLNIALLLHNLVEKQNLKCCNLILISALITTFSTGGILSGLLVLLSYFVVKRNNYLVSLVGLIIFVYVTQYVMSLEYVGEKLIDQMESTEIGTDVSRFSAFLTQIEMIKNSPILGGEKISAYLSGESKTLASGTLLPFVQYGIPIGCFYLILMLYSFIKMTKAKGANLITGVLLFISILFISFSQTILLSSWMFVMIFVGLNSSNNKYYGTKIRYPHSGISF